jgi:hypothetical protein
MRSWKQRLIATTAAVIALAAAPKAPVPASAATTNGTVTFSNTTLNLTQGSNNPSIVIGSDGTMAIDALDWLTFGTELWTGPYGSTPPRCRARCRARLTPPFARQGPLCWAATTKTIARNDLTTGLGNVRFI